MTDYAKLQHVQSRNTHMHVHHMVNIQNSACRLANMDNPDRNPSSSIIVNTSDIIRPTNNLHNKALNATKPGNSQYTVNCNAWENQNAVYSIFYIDIH